MFGSTILDLALGIIFMFLIISLITSAVTEMIASAFSWRAETLLQGIKDLLNDPDFNGLALKLYNHAAVNARADGTAKSQAELDITPSYIDAKQFAAAFLDITELIPGTDVATLNARVEAAVSDTQLRALLKGIITRAGGNIIRIRDDLAVWFEIGMDRVAGVYKRKTQICALIVGLASAIIFNIDAVKIAEALWAQPMLMKGFSASDSQLAKGVLAQAEAIGPLFGWSRQAWNYTLTDWNWLYVVAGWLISAVATLFGAPFWFDALQKFVQLRGAGSE